MTSATTTNDDDDDDDDDDDMDDADSDDDTEMTTKWISLSGVGVWCLVVRITHLQNGKQQNYGDAPVCRFFEEKAPK